MGYLYITRHGQTVWNVEGKVCGVTDIELTESNYKIIVDNDIYLGEILISIDTAKKQAQNGIAKEILTLITHGVLHLLGFDHMTDEDYNFIVNVQNQIIQKLWEG